MSAGVRPSSQRGGGIHANWDGEVAPRSLPKLNRTAWKIRMEQARPKKSSKPTCYQKWVMRGLCRE
jgi:hypothetical protein